jgi:hypothetical protein
MKYILAIILTLFAYECFCQTVQTNTKDSTIFTPTTSNSPYTRVIVRGRFKADTLTITLRDTTFQPRDAGTVTLTPAYGLYSWNGSKWVGLGSGGGGSSERFGIEDNLGIQDRNVDMQDFGFFIDNSNSFGIYQRPSITGAFSGIDTHGDATSAGIRLIATDSVTGNSQVLSVEGDYIKAITSGTYGGVSPPPITYLPLTVNGNYADNTGNITISGGSGTVTSIATTSPVTGGTITTTGTIGLDTTTASGGWHSKNYYDGRYVPLTRTVNGKALSSNITLNLASSDFANQGTTTTVLHGNASGNPSFGAIGLTTDVTGTLPVTNGGTGLATIAQGDLLYGSASNTLSALSKNTSSTRYLSNSGTSNNPAWAQVDLTNGVTGTLPFTNGGLGINSATNGDILYYNSGWQKLSKGNDGNVLGLASGLPVWSPATFADTSLHIIYSQTNSVNPTVKFQLADTVSTQRTGFNQSSPAFGFKGQGKVSTNYYDFEVVNFLNNTGGSSATLDWGWRTQTNGGGYGSYTYPMSLALGNGALTVSILNANSSSVGTSTALIFNVNGFGEQTSSGDGIIMDNGAAATNAVQSQWSKRQRWHGSYWNGSSSVTNDFINEFQVGPSERALVYSISSAGGSYTRVFSIATNGMLTLTRPYATSGSTPSNSAGTGAGTSPTITITGNDIAGYISIATGTSPTASGNIVTVTFSTALTNTPTSIQLTPANANAAGELTKFYVDQSTASSNSWIIKNTSSALTASTTYLFYYTITQ